MNQATNWWLHNTSAGRRTLERMLPTSALPPETRRQICAERGHDYWPGLTNCARCGAPKEER
jgi:hypothetical protein